MKKLLVVVLAVMLLTFATVSAQETQTVAEVNWNDVASYAEAVDPNGKFFLVADTGLKMWVPSWMESVELAEADMAEGMIVFLVSNDGNTFAVVNYLDLEGATLEDGYEGLLELSNYKDVEMGVINGLKALSYTAVEEDMIGLSFVDTDGYMIQFLFYPASDEAFAQVAALMGASIQEAE